MLSERILFHPEGRKWDFFGLKGGDGFHLRSFGMSAIAAPMQTPERQTLFSSALALAQYGR